MKSSPSFTQPVAVIDIGTSAIRMTVAEIGAGRKLRVLDELEQSVNLGKDAFINGEIPTASVEACVGILRRFRQVVKEYGADERLRAVATTAVREASNREAFLDRIYIATGIEVEVVDESEMTRLLYNSLLSRFIHEPGLAGVPVLVVDVGAGLTEALLLKSLSATASYTYRLGSLRLRTMLAQYDAPVEFEREVMENQVQIMLEDLHHAIPPRDNLRVVVIGGDVQFAAGQLVPNYQPGDTVELELTRLHELARELLAKPVDELVRAYQLSIPDAETVGPALLVVTHMAASYGADRITVVKATLREGLLKELALQGEWSNGFIDQIKQSARELARKYDADENHGLHVAELGQVIFDALRDEHGLGTREGVLLYLAGLVHEVGLFVSNRAHHKHSYYLINNSDLFGLSDHQTRMVALISRYHRRALPRPSHEGYRDLGREDRLLISKLAAIHRVADALDRSLSQRIREISCSMENGALVVIVPGITDFSLESLALRQKGDLMERVFGLKVVLRAG